VSGFGGVDGRAMMGTVLGMLAGYGAQLGIVAIGGRVAPDRAPLVQAGAWLAGATVGVVLAQRFAAGDPRPALFAAGFSYLVALQALFTAPHPVWMMAVGGAGVPVLAGLVWWLTRGIDPEYEP
jgi:hypothetical protein